MASLMGYLPTRVKFGDNEAEWLTWVGEAVAEVADSVPNENRADAAAALESIARTTPEVAAPAIAAGAYGEMVLAMLSRAVYAYSIRSGKPPLRLQTWREGLDRGADATIAIKRGDR